MAETRLRDNRERFRALRQLEDWLEVALLILSGVWVILLAVELTRGAGPVNEASVTVIWVIFVLEFALRFIIAPKKLSFLRKSWLTAFALLLPALRVFRIARVAYVLKAGRAVRGLKLARVVTAFNRGLGSLRNTMGRFGIGYVLSLTTLVMALGTAGIFSFERRGAGGEIESMGDALWFTAMLITTSGSDYWPRATEGRVLCFLLALYAFAVFGYVTATLASILMGQESIREDDVDRQLLHSLPDELRERLSNDFGQGTTQKNGLMHRQHRGLIPLSTNP